MFLSKVSRANTNKKPLTFFINLVTKFSYRNVEVPPNEYEAQVILKKHLPQVLKNSEVETSNKKIKNTTNTSEVASSGVKQLKNSPAVTDTHQTKTKLEDNKLDYSEKIKNNSLISKSSSSNSKWPSFMKKSKKKKP